MSLLKDSNVLSVMAAYLQPVGLTVMTSDPTNEGEEAFFIDGLKIGTTQFVLPKWWTAEWQKGFGGWLITSGQSVRFVRHRLSHHNIYTALAAVKYYAEEQVDFRTESFKKELWGMLPPSGFFFQDLDMQLGEEMARLICEINNGMSKSRYGQIPAQGRFRNGINKYLNSFQIVRRQPQDTNEEKLRFLQYRVTMGYPEHELPGGVEGLFRERFVLYMHESSQEGLWNVWQQGPFRASVACTSKGTPGEWVTTIPPAVFRQTPKGEELTEDLTIPLMMLAGTPIGYNRKRTYREGNAWSNAEPFYDLHPIEEGIWNGFEQQAGADLQERQTEANVLIAAIDTLNLYQQNEETLNLDDILVTDEGRTHFRIKYQPEKTFSAEQWALHSHEYIDSDGNPLSGYILTPRLTPYGVVGQHDNFIATMTVQEPIRPDDDHVTKLLVQMSHKAMAKQIRARVRAIDRSGREWPVHLIVSGQSIIDKKLPELPLAAAAGRAGIGFIRDYEHAIHPGRSAWSGEGRYLDWANEFPDLVRETANRLNDKGEDPQGLVSIYVMQETLNLSAPAWQYVGEGLVGPVRVSRLSENEREGTRSKEDDAVPYQIFLRFLANREISLEAPVLRTIDQLIEQYNELEHCEMEQELVSARREN